MSFDDVLEEWRAGLVSAGELAMAAVEGMAAGADVETTAARLPRQGRAALLEWVAGQPGKTDEVVVIGRGEPPALADEALTRLRRWLHGRTRRRVRYLVDRARELEEAGDLVEADSTWSKAVTTQRQLVSLTRPEDPKGMDARLRLVELAIEAKQPGIAALLVLSLRHEQGSPEGLYEMLQELAASALPSDAGSHALPVDTVMDASGSRIPLKDVA